MHTQAFRLTGSQVLPLDFTASTLDEITLQLSDGFYTTFSTLKGGRCVLGLRAHLNRLYIPANEIGLTPSVSETDLRRHIAALTQQYLPQESRIRLVLTKDTGDVYIGIQPFTPPAPEIYAQGVHVVTTEMARHDPRIKGTDFISRSLEQRKQVKGDVYEVLLIKNGGVLEGMTSNFYVIQHVIACTVPGTRASRQAKQSPSHDATLITAQRGILLGVTRRIVLRIARRQGMSMEYRSPRLEEVFDEAFLTSSSRGVVPIVKIDGKAVGQGRVGAWTKTLSLAYQAYIEERSEEILQS